MGKAAQCSLRVCSSTPVLQISKDENGERESQGPPRVLAAELLLWRVIETYLRSILHPQGGGPLIFLPKGISEVLQTGDCCRSSIPPLSSPLYVGVGWAYNFWFLTSQNNGTYIYTFTETLIYYSEILDML